MAPAAQFIFRYLADTAQTVCGSGVTCDTGLPQVNAGSGQLHTILQLAFGIIAAVAVLFVAIGGLRFVLSEGNPETAAKARNTMVYALVGLVIAISAEAIVTFVLTRIGS